MARTSVVAKCQSHHIAKWVPINAAIFAVHSSIDLSWLANTIVRLTLVNEL